MLTESQRHASSFRDPSGFVFRGENDVLYRQVNQSYESDYRMLMDSGLYAELVDSGLLIEHEEVSLSHAVTSDAVYVLQPRELPFMSWAYEWSFSALRDAALLTLDIQRRAVKKGMWLKDASNFNVQFDGSMPVMIDSLSFERYTEGSPWPAYGQFCRHFLAPLALMAKTDIGLLALLLKHLDGIPLDLCSKLLPRRTKISPGLLMHIHLHSRFVQKYSSTSSDGPESKQVKGKVSRTGLLALIDSLEATIQKLRWKPAGTEWAEYYDEHSYSEAGFEEKKQLVAGYIERVTPGVVWDLGANVGVFSRLALEQGSRVFAFDIDPACVDRFYRQGNQERQTRLTPLLLDLSNPTPAIGWANRERESLLERSSADLVMALALVHHIAISNNVPLISIASLFSRISKHLIIEFVPKGDPQVRRLLQSRKDIYAEYTQEGFESAFSTCFDILESASVGDDGRQLYLMASHNSPTGN